MELSQGALARLDRLSADDIAVLVAIVQHRRVWVERDRLGCDETVLDGLIAGGWIVSWATDGRGRPLAGGPFLSLTPWGAEQLAIAVVERVEEQPTWGACSKGDEDTPVILDEPDHVRLMPYGGALPLTADVEEMLDDGPSVLAFDPLAGDYAAVLPAALGGPIVRPEYDPDTGEERLTVMVLCGTWVFPAKRDRGRCGA